MTSSLVVSIPHTGTRFLKARLGITEHIHTIVYWDSLMREVNKYDHIVAPLRDPSAVWQSTYRRWLKPDAHDNLHRFIAAWYMMHALTLVRDVDFIPVDLKLDPRITDWEPVTGELERNNKIKPNLCLMSIYALPFVAQYYSIRPKGER